MHGRLPKRQRPDGFGSSFTALTGDRLLDVQSPLEQVVVSLTGIIVSLASIVVLASGSGCGWLYLVPPDIEVSHAEFNGVAPRILS